MLDQSRRPGAQVTARNFLADQLAVAVERSPGWLGQVLSLARVDLEPASAQPRTPAVIIATLLAIAGSLLADAVIVAIGRHLFPALGGYRHFMFADYAKLTVMGVIIACAGWPVVNRITSSARWLFLRLAILVSAVLLLPDAYLLVRGDPTRAVAVLAVMHIAIAIVTYNVLVHVAKPRRSPLRRR